MATPQGPLPPANIPWIDKPGTPSLAFRQYFLTLDAVVKGLADAITISPDGHELVGLTSPITGLGIATNFLTRENAGRPGTVGGADGLFIFSDDQSSSYLAFFKTRATVKGPSVTAV